MTPIPTAPTAPTSPNEPAVPVLLDPRLGLDAHDLADAWNADPGRAQQGRARVEAAPAVSYDPAGVILLIAGNVALSLISAAIYDLAKEALRRARGPDRLRRYEVQIDGKTYVVLAPEE